MTSASRMAPPGWITEVAPASAAWIRPSGNGKKASDAQAEPTARDWFQGDAIRETAFRNSTLQGAYLMMAARAIGLDCGPMSGFDKAKVDAEFFAGTSIEANFICAIGYGTEERLFPRLPRLPFDEACQIV